MGFWDKLEKALEKAEKNADAFEKKANAFLEKNFPDEKKKYSAQELLALTKVNAKRIASS